jgi:hypothetical protein
MPPVPKTMHETSTKCWNNLKIENAIIFWHWNCWIQLGFRWKVLGGVGARRRWFGDSFPSAACADSGECHYPHHVHLWDLGVALSGVTTFLAAQRRKSPRAHKYIELTFVITRDAKTRSRAQYPWHMSLSPCVVRYVRVARESWRQINLPCDFASQRSARYYNICYDLMRRLFLCCELWGSNFIMRLFPI